MFQTLQYQHSEDFHQACIPNASIEFGGQLCSSILVHFTLSTPYSVNLSFPPGILFWSLGELSVLIRVCYDEN